MLPLIPFLVPAVLLLCAYSWIRKQERYLEALCKKQVGKFITKIDFLRQALRAEGSYRFDGVIDRRVFEVEYFYRWRSVLNIGAPPSEERLEIRFPVVQKFWLRMLLEPGASDIRDEVILGNKALDTLYVIHSNQQGAAAAFLNSQTVLNCLKHFRIAFERLEIHRGLGTVEIGFPTRWGFHVLDMRIVLESLAQLFAEYEAGTRLSIAVTVSGEAESCPYCRESLSRSSERILECAQCGTHLHENCWKENGQCTTWGCVSGSATVPQQENF